MSERHGLRDLQVSEPRHHAFGVLVGKIEERALQRPDEPERLIDRRAQEQADVRRDLVVARARGVQALAGLSGELDQPALDIEMNVLVRLVPLERAGLYFFADPGESFLDFRKIVLADDASRPQHARVGERALDVMVREALVERDRGREMLHEFGRGLGKPARPGLVRGFVVC